jgi:hypothetical protein
MSAPKPSFMKLKASRIPSRHAHDLAGYGGDYWQEATRNAVDGATPADTTPPKKRSPARAARRR